MPFCLRRDGTNISSLTLSPKTEGEANDVGSIFLLPSYSTASPCRPIFTDPRSPRTLQSSYRYFVTPSAVQRQRAHYCAKNRGCSAFISEFESNSPLQYDFDPRGCVVAMQHREHAWRILQTSNLNTLHSRTLCSPLVLPFLCRSLTIRVSFPARKTYANIIGIRFTHKHNVSLSQINYMI